MIFSDFFKALAQLSDTRFRKVLFLGIGLTLGLLFGATVIFVTAIQLVLPDTVSLPFVGQIGWLGNVISFGTLFIMIGLSVFLMVPVASAITSFFLDDVAQAVEDKHYPGLPTPPKVGLSEAIKDTVSFLATLISLNILAFLLYFIVPFLGFPIFYLLNGYLLGREYFQMVAIRREGREGAAAMRKTHKYEIWFAGCLMAVPLTFPIVNLLVPVLGAATFTHLYHRISRS